MSEPTVALAFTADPWVEELHRFLADHGGARVRCVLVERDVALEESYDVLVVGHRWPPLTRELVQQVHARSHAILGVFDRTEPASREHLTALQLDSIVASDAGCGALVRAIAAVARPHAMALVAPEPATRKRQGRCVVIGGAPGTGRIEVAIQVAIACARERHTVLVDADDIAPAIAQRLGLPIEPNVRSAIDAVEHGNGDVAPSLARIPNRAVRVLAGMPNARAWGQVHPGEVVRVIDRIAERPGCVVIDGAGELEAIGAGTRGRHAIARALVAEADSVIAVCDGAPHGVTRLLEWIGDARSLRAELEPIVVVNRAPATRFARGELYRELCDSVSPAAIVFCAADAHVVRAAWQGTVVAKGNFTRALDVVPGLVA
jgi:MinD-like ATPase involved in chromosome partitioning or flagellar assembly